MNSKPVKPSVLFHLPVTWFMEILYAIVTCLNKKGQGPTEMVTHEPWVGSQFGIAEIKNGGWPSLFTVLHLCYDHYPILDCWRKRNTPKKKKNESKKAFLCKSQAGLLVSVVWQKKKKKKKKGKKSPQRHGISYKSLFRDPFTITIPRDMHSLLLVVKGKISRFWKMHAHKQGSHRLRKTSRETLRHNASPSVQTDT